MKVERIESEEKSKPLIEQGKIEPSWGGKDKRKKKETGAKNRRRVGGRSQCGRKVQRDRRKQSR